MGNSASNANNPNRAHRTDQSLSSSPTGKRDASISPGPGNPHPSLRTKKKSLELPDFVSLTATPSTVSARGRQKSHTPATAIPIPTPPTVRNPFSHYTEARGIQLQRHRPKNNFSSTVSISRLHDEFDEMAALETPSIPFPPPSRAHQREQLQQVREQQQRQQQQQRSASKQRGRQPQMSSRQQAQVARIQELYDQSLDPHIAAPPSSPASAPRPSHAREVVRSSIPVLLGEATNQAEMQENNVLSPIQEDLSADPVPLTIVWKGGGTEVVLARAGDDDWKGRQPMERESPDSKIWTATVYLHPGAHHIRFLVDGQWRVTDDFPAAVDDQGSLANYVAVYVPAPPQLSSPAPAPPPPAARKMVPGQSFWSATSADGDNDTDDSLPAQSPTLRVTAKHPQNAAAIAYVQARWTNVLPLELIEAQKEEEMYLAASAGQFEAQQQQASSGRVAVTGFIPAPNIPAAPGLPRHLDRLILNSRVGEKPVGQERAGTPGSQGSGVVGSGQGGGRRRDREHRERERDRERERERERERDRDRERDRERDRDRDRDRDRAGRSRRPDIPPPPPPPSEDGSVELDIESTYVPMNPSAAGVPTSPRNQTDSSFSSAAGTSGTGNNTSASTAATTPHVSVPATPTLSPTQSTRKLAVVEGPSQPVAGRSTQPLPPTLERAPISDSRIITIDTSTMPAITDDASVLPVPSHVVLHHLCTSAIKNGVLAVANTTRYRKKYLTTIYYKPT